MKFHPNKDNLMTTLRSALWLPPGQISHQECPERDIRRTIPLTHFPTHIHSIIMSTSLQTSPLPNQALLESFDLYKGMSLLYFHVHVLIIHTFI